MARLSMPGAWMIGPLLVGIAYSCTGAQLRVPRICFIAAQVTIGCVLAQAFSPSVARTAFAHFPLLFGAICVTLLISSSVGWALTKTSSIEPFTATFGTTPGNAAMATVMAAELGADPRIVAFMQYVRVIVVVLSAALVARFVFHDHAYGNPILTRTPGEPAGSLLESYAETVVLGVIAATVAKRIRLPSPYFMGPVLAGATLTSLGVAHFAVPTSVLDAAYVTIGLSIGLNFTVAALRYCLRVLPQLAIGTAILIAGCGFLAAGLARVAHIDPFTAYLATTPGGFDSVAIIALSGGVDVPVVLAAQVVRLFMVVLLGTHLARLVARLATAAVTKVTPLREAADKVD